MGVGALVEAAARSVAPGPAVDIAKMLIPLIQNQMKGKGKPRGKSGNKNNNSRREKQGGSGQIGSDRSPMGRRVTAPVSIGFVMTDKDFKAGVANCRNFKDPEHGAGVSVEAHCILSAISTGSTLAPVLQYGTYAFTNTLLGSGYYSTTTTGRYTGMYILPQYMTNTRLYSHFDMYSHYRIRRIRILYTPNNSTQNSGSISMALTTDPVFVPEYGTSSVTSIEGISQTDCFVETPVWKEASLTCTYNGSKWWHTSGLSIVGDSDSTNAANLRDICQYRLACLSDNTNTSSPYGRLNLSMVVEFSGPLPPTAAQYVGPVGTTSSLASTSIQSLMSETPRTLRREPITSKDLLITDRKSRDTLFDNPTDEYVPVIPLKPRSIKGRD